MIGESLNEAEHLTTPDFTNLLCVLQILLYCLLRLLDGGIIGAVVLHSPLAVAVFGVVGKSTAGTVGLRVTGQEFPVRSSLDPPLLPTPLCSSSLELFWREIVPEQFYSDDQSL